MIIFINTYRIYPKYSDTSTPYHICSKIWTSTIHYPMLCLKIAGWVANSVDPDETPCSAASHLGLYCLLRPVCPNTYGKYGIMQGKYRHVWYAKDIQYMRYASVIFFLFCIKRVRDQNIVCSDLFMVWDTPSLVDEPIYNKSCHQTAELAWTAALRPWAERSEYCWINLWTYIYHHIKYKPNPLYGQENISISLSGQENMRFNINQAHDFDLKVIGKSGVRGVIAELNLGPISIMISTIIWSWKYAILKTFRQNSDIKVLSLWPWP